MKKERPLHKVDSRTFLDINVMATEDLIKKVACGKKPNAVTWSWKATTCKLCLKKEPK